MLAIGVFLLALALRCVALQQTTNIGYMDLPLSDARIYADRAMGIAQGDWAGPASFVHAPLYAYLLAPFARVWGDGEGFTWLRAARGAQVVAGSLACALVVPMTLAWLGAIGGLAERRQRLIAALAGVGLAAYPAAVFYDLLIQKTTVDLFISVLLLWVMGWVFNRGLGVSVLGWALVGSLIGLFTLNRQNALALGVLIVAMPLWLAWLSSKHERTLNRSTQAIKRAMPAMAAGLLALIVVLTPWAARNKAVLGDWVISTPNLGQNLMMGNRADATGTYLPTVRGRGTAEYEQEVWVRVAERALGRTLTAREVSNYFRDQAIDWIRQHPRDWFNLTMRKLGMVFAAHEAPDTEDLYHYRGYSSLLRISDSLWHFGVLLPLAVLGVTLSLGSWRRLWPLYAWLAITAVTVAAFVVFGRYRFPMVPALMLFASLGAVQAFSLIRDGQFRRLLWPALASIAAAFAANQTSLGARSPQVLSFVNHAAVLADLGRSDEAFAEAERAIALDPTNADGYAMRASIALDAARFSDAQRDYRQAVQLDANFPGAWTGLGNARLALGQILPAIEAYERSLSLWPDDATTCAQLGAALAQLNEPDRAQQAIDRALQLDAGNAIALNNQAALMMLRGDAASAIAVLERAITADRSRIEPWLGLVVAKHNLGQTDASLAAAQAAWKAFPRDERAQKMYFEVLLRAQRFEEARDALTRIYERDPAAAWTLEAMRLLREAMPHLE